MTEPEFREAVVQVVGWVKHPGPALPGQRGAVDEQRILLSRKLVRELLKRAGEL